MSQGFQGNNFSGKAMSAKIKQMLLRFLAVPFFLAALWWYLMTVGIVDCNPRRFGGCGLLDVGFEGVFVQVFNWLVTALLAVPGVALWVKSNQVQE